MNLRLFLAVPVPLDVRDWLSAALEALKLSGADYKWVSPATVHWTLHFFGDVPEEQTGRIRGLMDEAAAESGPFEWRPGGLGGFPSEASPKILWAGLRAGAEEMGALAELVKSKAAAAGFAVEERPFAAHLTLGRMRSPRGLARLRELTAKGLPNGPRARAESLVLYRSELKPAGPEHTVLHAARLGARVP